jgi:hypothetical protein
MSDGEKPAKSNEVEPQGPNLKLLYSLILFALLAAIAIALMIVLPFYQRR